MPRTRVFALLPVAALMLGCTEPLAPREIEHEATPADAPVAASFARQGTGSPLDIHAVNVGIESMVFNNVVIDLYSFHVHGRPDDMKGKFNLYQIRIVDGESVAEIIASGRMICGTVVGNKGRVAGRIEKTTFPEGLPVGQELIWSVTDNGRSENNMDTASQPLGAPFGGEAYCLGGGPYLEQLLQKGQVKVRS